MTSGPYAATETYDNRISDNVPLWTWPQAFPGGAGTAFGTVNAFATAVNLLSSSVHQWNLTLERQTGPYGVRVSYIGTAAAQLPYLRNLNQPPASTTPFTQARRPFPLINNITYFDRGANQAYHALQVQVTRRLASGFLLNAHYTLARNLTDSEDCSNFGGTIEDAYNRDREWGDDPGSPRHRFVSSFIWEVPVGRGRRLLGSAHPLVNGILGGWTASGNLAANTGVFFTPTFTGRDISGTNTIGGRPDRICDGNLSASERSIHRWFDASRFVIPAANSGRFGTSGRATIRGPGFWGLNSGVFKYFQMPGRESFKLRGQALVQNQFNHPRFGGIVPPDLNIVSPTAGRFSGTDINHGISDIAPQRLMELGLRLEF